MLSRIFDFPQCACVCMTNTCFLNYVGNRKYFKWLAIFSTSFPSCFSILNCLPWFSLPLTPTLSLFRIQSNLFSFHNFLHFASRFLPQYTIMLCNNINLVTPISCAFISMRWVARSRIAESKIYYVDSCYQVAFLKSPS